VSQETATANPKNPLARSDLSFIFLTPYIFYGHE
jgi:hypothetical protein